MSDDDKHRVSRRMLRRWTTSNPLHRAGRALSVTFLLLILSAGGHAAPNWGQKTPPASPLRSSTSAMAFDAARGQIVLYRFGETWVWNGSTWTKKSPATSPSLRSRAALTYDPVRQHTILFGGLTASSGDRLVDTWIWDGDNWTQKFPATVPSFDPSSSGFNLLTFDTAHGEAILVMDGTWVWDGTNWSQVADAEHSPGDRTAAIAFDKANGQAVVYCEGATWIWEGAKWMRRFPATTPPPLLHHTMAYDELRERVVVFGGWIDDGAGTDSNATWTWDGANWTTSSPQTSPPGRERHSMEYDPIRGQLVVFGGMNLQGTTFGDTWVYPSNSIAATNGTPQFAAPASQFALPLEVTVTDVQGSPVGGDLVSFVADPSLVSLSSSTTTTGSDGKAQVTATATAIVAGHVVTATIADGGSAIFNLTNASSAAGSITPNPGTSPQTTSVNQTFAMALAVLVRDGTGNPVSGVTVTFTAPAAGASGTFTNTSVTTQAVTDGNGVATSTSFRANATAGTFRVIASAAGRPDGILALTNRRGPATMMVTTPGSTPQSAAIGQAYPVPLAVTIADVNNNPAAGIAVTFVAPVSDATGTFANGTTTTTAVTGSNGVATASAFSGRTSPGNLYNVRAKSAGLTDVGFSLTNAGAAAEAVSWGARTAPSPIRLSQIDLAPDANGKVVLPGGAGTFGFADSRTWLWDGNVWTMSGTTAWPNPPRFGYAVTYDAGRKKVVLFGGHDLVPGGQSYTPPFGDTWEWDGANWTKRNPAQSPPAQIEHTMAYDAARQQVVLFGGGQTWIWDGTNWTQKSLALHPPAFFNQRMAYDAARQQLVLVGGTDGFAVRETWVWNGTAWSKKAQAQNPTLYSFALAYDAPRQQVVLFGQNETWVWNGTTWSKKTPSTSPPDRSYHGMTYDNAHGVVVLFGGQGNNVRLNDTWTWDGTTWTPKGGSGSAPTAARFSAMAPDPTPGQLVLFFGTDKRETWVWDGSKWTKKAPAASPPARGNHAMAFDAARNQTVLFGGAGGGGNDECYGNCKDGTWVWDGTTWTQKNPAFNPPGQTEHAMTYDAARQQIVMYGRRPSESTGNTFTWDGNNWTQRAPATFPPYRDNPALAYDAARQGVVLFGGVGNKVALNDTWTWDGTTWTQKFPALSPPAQSGQQMTYDASRQRIVLFGQFDSGTWTWDGTTWTQQLPLAAPSSRFGHAIAYDSVRAQAVLFGGGPNYLEAFNDTWVYPAPIMTAIAGTPQFAPPGQSFATALAVKVNDSNNNPLAGAVVTFTASPFGASGTFANASVTTAATTDASGIATASTFTANGTTGAYIVTASAVGQNATFALNNGSAPPAFALSVSKSGTGVGTVTGIGINCGSDCGESYVSGTGVTLTAAPLSGSTFSGWGGDCSGFGAASACTLNMDGAKNVTASFAPPPTIFVLTVVKTGTGSGKVTGTGIDCGGDCGESYVSGANVTLTATPNPSAPGGTYIFVGWSGDCSGFGAQSTCLVGMTAAKNVIARFGYVGFGSDYSRNYVQKAYVAYYGRPADPGGQSYWAGRMDAEGQSLNAIIGAFGYSDEFNRRYGGLSYTALVTKIYQQALGRDPDPAGLAYYVSELQAGRRSLQSITLDVLNGAITAPDSTVVANKLDVAEYYTGKVAVGCAYGTEQDGVNALSGVTSVPATVTAAKAAIHSRCGP